MLSMCMRFAFGVFLLSYRLKLRWRLRYLEKFLVKRTFLVQLAYNADFF